MTSIFLLLLFLVTISMVLTAIMAWQVHGWRARCRRLTLYAASESREASIMYLTLGLMMRSFAHPEAEDLINVGIGVTCMLNQGQDELMQEAHRRVDSLNKGLLIHSMYETDTDPSTLEGIAQT